MPKKKKPKKTEKEKDMRLTKVPKDMGLNSIFSNNVIFYTTKWEKVNYIYIYH